MERKKYNVAIFASGNGTNAEAIIKYFLGNKDISVALLVSNNAAARALQRAENLDVETFIIDNHQFREGTELLAVLHAHQITHIVLAGFLWLIPSYLLDAFPIINIHPSLLPKFGGKGMYGKRVHEAVRTAGESTTGITIHEVNDTFDDGKILFQASTPVDAADSAELIAGKVHALEYEHYPVVIAHWITGK